MNDTEARNAIKGGEFLIRETQAEDVFIPEEWNEEQLMIAETCTNFLAQHVTPNLVRIDGRGTDAAFDGSGWRTGPVRYIHT
jgi:hypothetical protein